MSAIRLARAFTHRDRILKFAGCYHGHVDALLADGGSGLATLGIPSSPGVPTGVTADTIVTAFNDVDAVGAAVERYGEGLAAIVVEPVAGNMGVVPPEPGFLEALRALCDASGALLVFDEVITGFRVARGGAQERFGVTPRPDDPRQDRRRRPSRRGVRRPGRRDGAARPGRRRLPGRDALREPARNRGRDLRPPPAARSGRATRGSRRRARGSRPGSPRSAGSSGSARWRRSSSPTAESAASTTPSRSDTERYGALFRHLLERGIYVAPSQFECLFVSLAHEDEHIDQTIDAVADFFAVLSSGRRWRPRPPRRARSGPRRSCPTASASSRRSSRRSRRSGSRSRSRRSTRATSSTTAGRGSSQTPGRRGGDPARRLPLRPRARARCGDRRARCGRRRLPT